MAEKRHGAFTEETGSGWVLHGNKSYHDGNYDDALRCYLEAQRKEHNKVIPSHSDVDLGHEDCVRAELRSDFPELEVSLALVLCPSDFRSSQVLSLSMFAF